MVKQILLLSNPRTGCNLLERMLSKQPNVVYFSHPFKGIMPMQVESLRNPLSPELSAELRSRFQTFFEEVYAKWERTMKEAEEKDQTVFTHTHPHFMLVPEVTIKYVSDPTQPLQVIGHGWSAKPGEESTTCTAVPDSFYLQPGMIPLITIRHPALTVPSIYRTGRATPSIHGPPGSTLLPNNNLGWSRQLYDRYVAHGITPLVLEADDYMTSKSYMRDLCLATCLDPDSVIYSWPKATEEEMQQMQPPVAREVLKTLLNSDGLIPGLDAKNLVMVDEEVKWREKFGEDGARFIKEIVNMQMPNYEYLKERRFRGGEQKSTLEGLSLPSTGLRYGDDGFQ